MIFFVSKSVSGDRTNLKDICGQSRYVKAMSVTETFDLEPGKYNVTCCLQEKGLEAPFELSFDVPLEAKVLSEKFVSSMEGSWKENESGGHMSIDNPQVPLHVREAANFRITLQQLDPLDKSGLIFFVLPWNKLKKRRKTYSESDIVAQSSYVATLKLSTEVHLTPGSYIIVPCARNIPQGRFCITVESLHGQVDPLSLQIAEHENNVQELDCMEVLKDFEVEDRVFFCEDPTPKLIEYLKEKKSVFRDSVFPPTNKSLYDSTGLREGKLSKDVVHEWKRTSDIFDNPDMYVDGIDVEDIVQSEALGNCWLCQGIATSATSPDRIQELFYPAEYNPYGVYSVRLFHEGNFHYVLVDDYIPCKRDGEPAFARSSDDQEIWTMILEKAFAKIFQSYEGLIANDPGKALLYITGGKIDSIEADSPTDELWEKMLHYSRQKWIMGVTTCKLPDEESSRVNEQGIVSNHAYSVIHTHNLPQYKLRLVRIRNTWGHSEWRGPWSDKSNLWTDELKEQLSYEDKEDGIFFMTFEDMCAQFKYLTFCQITRDDYPHVYRVQGVFEPGQGGYGLVDNPRFAMKVLTRTKFIIRFILNEDVPKNRPVRVFVCQGGFKFPSLTKSDVIHQSRYLTTQKLILECTLEPSDEQYVIYMCLGSSMSEPVPFKLTVATDNEIAFDVPFRDPFPYKVELNDQEWNPCGGYMCTQNPRFKITIEADCPSEFVVNWTRRDSQAAKGMRIVLIRHTEGTNPSPYLTDENCVSLSRYQVTKSTTMGVESAEPGTYLLIGCLQEKGLEGAMFDLSVKAEHPIVVERVL